MQIKHQSNIHHCWLNINRDLISTFLYIIVTDVDMQFAALNNISNLTKSRYAFPLVTENRLAFFQKILFLLRSKSAIKDLVRAFENTQEHRNRIRTRGAIPQKPWGEQ